MMRVWKLRYGEPLDVHRVWIVSPAVLEALLLLSEPLAESLLAEAREASETPGEVSVGHREGMMSAGLTMRAAFPLNLRSQVRSTS